MATTASSAASATRTSTIPRWNRAASDCGHGSVGTLISRPWCELVQSALTGQALQIDGFAWYRICRCPSSYPEGHSIWSWGQTHASCSGW